MQKETIIEGIQQEYALKIYKKGYKDSIKDLFNVLKENTNLSDRTIEDLFLLIGK